MKLNIEQIDPVERMEKVLEEIESGQIEFLKNKNQRKAAARVLREYKEKYEKIPEEERETVDINDETFPYKNRDGKYELVHYTLNGREDVEKQRKRIAYISLHGSRFGYKED